MWHLPPLLPVLHQKLKSWFFSWTCFRVFIHSIKVLAHVTLSEVLYVFIAVVAVIF